jgi:hypothetical protein
VTVGIGVDPGERWSAAVLVDVDGNPVDGFTLGPIDDDGLMDRLANNELEPADVSRYARRFLDYLRPLYQQAHDLAAGGDVLVAVEKITRPRRRDIPVRAWLIPWTVMHYVCGAYDDVNLVPCKGKNHGVRHQPSRGGDGNMRAAYPAELGRRRPAGWGVNEHHRGARDHERAAYDVLIHAKQLRNHNLIGVQ